jgi:hypothetical protein
MLDIVGSGFKGSEFRGLKIFSADGFKCPFFVL